MRPKKKKNMTTEELAIAQKKSAFHKRIIQSRAFADVIDGANHPKLSYIGRDDYGRPEERTPADKLYRSARRHVEAALADFRGEEPTTSDERKERRAARKTLFYKTCFRRFERIAQSVIETEVLRRTKDTLANFGITAPAAQPSVPPELVKVPAKPTEVKPAADPPRPATKHRKEGLRCDLCDEIIGSGKFCSMCKERLDITADLLVERGPLTASEVAEALDHYDGEEASALYDLEADPRFVKGEDGRWSVPSMSKKRPAPPASEFEPGPDVEIEYSDDPDESYFEEPDEDTGTD